MRLNRGTLILLAASVIVIVAVLILNNNQASAPEAEPTVDESGGPLFGDLTAESVVSLAVSENESGTFIRIARDAEDESQWVVTGPADSPERTVDQAAAAQAIADAVALAEDSRFEADNLADFGLDNPAFIIELDAGETALDAILVGNKNPTGNRYYMMTRNLAAASETDNAQDETTRTVLLVNTSAVEKITNLITEPPFEPLPTATPTATATLNPMSEVEIATATAEMESALATITAQPEVTASATPESE